QRDFIAAIIVAKIIHEAAGEHDSETAFAETEFITQLDVADWVFVARGMRQVPGIETRPLVLDDQRDRLRIDAISNPQDQISVLAVTPLDGISSHFHHGLFQVLDLAVGERGMGEEVGEHVMGLLKVCQLAANIEIDLAVGSPLQVLVVPEDRLVDDVVELSGREWLGQVTVGPDPHARGPMIPILERGHNNNRDQIGLSIPLQLVANGKAVDVRQHEIEQNQFRFLHRDGRPDLRTRVNLNRFEVASPNETGQNIVAVALIVDDQNGARHGENSKKPRNLERFLSLATIDGNLCAIFTRASKRDKGLQSTSLSGWLDDLGLHGLPSRGRAIDRTQSTDHKLSGLLEFGRSMVIHQRPRGRYGPRLEPRIRPVAGLRLR